MSFTFPTLIAFWLLPFLAVVIAIHLIHLLRHRRVPWAAMEFLLESKKKNQTSIRLKQLLLLLLRMAAIAAIVFLLAGPILQDYWSRLLGGSKVHHVILIDDSGSMTDQWAATSAFARGRQVVENIIARAGRESSQQLITLLRFSAASLGKPPEMLRELAAGKTVAQWAQRGGHLQPTALGAGPLAALETIEKRVKPAADERMVLYVVSDLRSAQWQQSAALAQVLERLAGNEAEIQLVDCVETAHENLAITELMPVPGQQATGVSLRMKMEVTNFGNTSVNSVPVQLRQNLASGGETGETGTLGAVTIDRIEAGQSAVRFFDVTFQTAGSHVLEAELPADPVELDNRRRCVVDVAASVPVLIIDDGGEDQSLFLQLALAPSPKVKTGVLPRVERSTFLRDDQLDRYHTIYLLNVAQLDQQEIDNLENYVRSGGGVVFFAGQELGRDFVNQSLYRGGEGLFPLPLSSPATLLVDRLQKAPDLQVQEDHPIFSRIFGGTHNNWLQSIVVQRYYAVDKQWNPTADPAVKVIARLRNGAPWMVEKQWGEGRVLAVLGTAAPKWHNWGRGDPSFVLWALDTQVYLSEKKVIRPQGEVGESLSISLPVADYQPLVAFHSLQDVEEGESGRQAATQVPATEVEGDATKQTASYGTILQPGIYEARLKRTDGRVEVRRFVYNAAGSESDLHKVDQGQLRGLLGDVPFAYHRAEEFLAPDMQEAGFPLAEQWWFFLLLLCLLAVEQWVAYSASYHPPTRSGGVHR